MTGFTQFEYGLSGRWLELLKTIAPQVARSGSHPRFHRGTGRCDAEGGHPGIRIPARRGIEPINIDVTTETERAVGAFAGAPNSGLIVLVSTVAQIQRKLLVTLAARHRLPAVYPYRFYAESGGLISYGPNLVEGYRRGNSRGSDPEGRAGRRPSSAGAEQVRAGDQSQDRQGAQPRNPTDPARPRRRGDRRTMFAAAHESAIGTRVSCDPRVITAGIGVISAVAAA
jgi:hypothetical protein